MLCKMSILMKNCKTFGLYSGQLLRSSSVTSQFLVRHSSYESKKFPDYHVLYKLNSVRTASIVNRLKRKTTLISGITVSGIYGLEIIHMVPTDIANAVAFAGISFTLFIHAVGYYCNNVVGYIYAKKDTKNLIISYVDFWGKRIDIQTTVDDVCCAEPTSRFLAPMFTTMNVVSPKVTLKLFLNGIVTDNEGFYNVFGLSL